MLYILLAITASTSIIVLLRVFSKLKINSFNAIMVNYVVASAFGFLSVPGGVDFVQIPAKPWFFLAVISGFLFIVGFNLFSVSARSAGVALTGMASRMSLLVSVMAGFFLFGDQPDVFRVAGIVIGIAGLYFAFRKDKLHATDHKLILLPLALLLVHGISDLMMKVGQHYYIDGDFSLFLASIFLFSLLFGTLFLIMRKPGGNRITRRDIFGGIIIGLVNWYSGYFLLLSLDRFDVSIVIPVINIGIVTATAFLGIAIFRERFKRSNIVGFILAMASIGLMLLSIK